MRPEDRLRDAYRALQEPGSERCPSDDDLAALAVGELEPARRDALADHVTGCRPCSENAAILLETHAEAAPRLPAGPSRRVVWIAAALFALMVSGTVIVVRSARREEAFRAASPAVAAAVEPAEGARLSSPPVAFRWPPSAGAERYRLKVFTSAGDVLWEADAGTDHAIAVPEGVRARVEAGRSYFWTVEVQLPFEKQRLGPFSFTLPR